MLEVGLPKNKRCSSTLLKIASRSCNLECLYLTTPSFCVLTTPSSCEAQFQLSRGALVTLCSILSRSNTLREDVSKYFAGTVTLLSQHDFALVQKTLTSGHAYSNQSCWKRVEAENDEGRRTRKRFELLCFYVAMNRFRGFFANHDQPVGLAPFVLAKCQHANGLHEATRSHYRAETGLLFSILRERVDWVTNARDSRP